jgi:hypothetical protein
MMKLRTMALALALACGFTANVEAKNKPNVKHHVKVRKLKKPKVRKFKPGKA